MKRNTSGTGASARAIAIPSEQLNSKNIIILLVTFLVALALALAPSFAFAGDAGKNILSTGIVTEKYSAVISAKVSSYVVQVCCDVGDGVAKGSTLVLLDSAEFAANVAMAKAKLDEATAFSQNARLSFARTETLLSRGSATQSSYDNAKAIYDGAIAGKALAKAALDKAKIFLSYTKLTAPINGVVDYKKIEAGELTAPGQALMRIVDTKNLWFETSVKESDINKVKTGQKVLVNIDSMKDKGVEGVVASIAPTGAKFSHTYKVRIDLRVTDGLKIGMYGKVNWQFDIKHSGDHRE